MSQTTSQPAYPATLQIDYQEKLNRVTTVFRIILVIPIAIILNIITGGGESVFTWDDGAGETVTDTTSGGAGIVGALFLVTVLLLLFRKRYPKWWFDFGLALSRFFTRISAYVLLITDKYPSTEDDQNIHLDVPYPNAQTELNRGLPLVKWFLAIPHYFVLFFLWVAVLAVTVVAWIVVIITGRYPRALFDFTVGVMRWTWRVHSYAILLATDKYPPFSLN